MDSLPCGPAVSTSACVHPPQVLEYRKLFPLLSNVLRPFQRFAVHGRLHACFDYHTSTGRLRCSAPNLQGLPTALPVQGAAGEPPANVAVRRLLRAAAGRVFVSADYSQVSSRPPACLPLLGTRDLCPLCAPQIELRLAAHLSGDKELCEVRRALGLCAAANRHGGVRVDTGAVVQPRRGRVCVDRGAVVQQTDP